MKFAVLGAGAIGGYVGAALARGGADVTLIARGPHLAAMAARGVRVLSPRGDFTAHPRATGDLAAVADADVVLVALKAYSLPGIAPRLGKLLSPGAAAIWAQNGIPWWYFQSLPELPAPAAGLQSVDPGGVIAASIAPGHNVGCVVYCSTEIVEPGVIRHIEGTRFTLGEPDGSRIAALRADLGRLRRGRAEGPGRGPAAGPDLAQAGRQRRVQPDHGADRGDAGRAGHAAGDARPAAGHLRRVRRGGGRLGIRFPVSLERRLEAGLAVGDHKTSMLQDLEAGKRLELDCMTGAVVELARPARHRRPARAQPCTPAPSSSTTSARAADRPERTPAGHPRRPAYPARPRLTEQQQWHIDRLPATAMAHRRALRGRRWRIAGHCRGRRWRIAWPAGSRRTGRGGAGRPAAGAADGAGC